MLNPMTFQIEWLLVLNRKITFQLAVLFVLSTYIYFKSKINNAMIFIIFLFFSKEIIESQLQIHSILFQRVHPLVYQLYEYCLTVGNDISTDCKNDIQSLNLFSGRHLLCRTHCFHVASGGMNSFVFHYKISFDLPFLNELLKSSLRQLSFHIPFRFSKVQKVKHKDLHSNY